MFATRTSLSLVSALLLALVPLGACEHDDDQDHVDENPNEEACEHFDKGPPVALTAAATAGDQAPKISNDHQRYDVTLVDVTGGKGGYVSFASPSGGYLFFVNASVPLTVTNAKGDVVKADSSLATVPECAAVKGRHIYQLPTGTYFIGINAGAIEKVSFVVEAQHTH